MTVFDALLKLLKVSLNTNGRQKEEITKELSVFVGEMTETEWMELAVCAKRNSVASLLYDTVELIETVPGSAKKEIEKYSRMIVQNSYRLLNVDMGLDNVLSKAGIPFCIMKGIAAAADFQVPELRKAGDVDILLTNPNDLEKAVREIEKLGFKCEETQHSLHHVSMSDPTELEIEVHTMLAEPFDNNRINEYIDRQVIECGKHTIRKSIMGAELPVLDDAYHAYELLLHMLQHFLRAGFGVKLLCDWVVLWNRGLSEEDGKTYLKLVTESGIKGFSDMITRACIKYLGLERKNVLWMKPFENGRSRDELEKETETFMEELMDAEEFGKAKNRMVALRGNGLFDYVREFHHQMHLNFPKAGKVFLFWPVLWIITLVRFLRNNKKVRSVSSKELFESAGKRGKLVKGMNLFR